MGLDVTAYSNATLLPEHEWDDDTCYDADHVRAYVYACFEQSFRGLVWSTKELGRDGTEFLTGREYLCNGETAELHTGYGGHRVFRERLASDVLGPSADEIWRNPDPYVDRPFFELINFADNEGCIGPAAATDLAADFRDHADKAAQVWRDPPPYQIRRTDVRPWEPILRRRYSEWQKIFEIASGGGLVRFY